MGGVPWTNFEKLTEESVGVWRCWRHEPRPELEFRRHLPDSSRVGLLLVFPAWRLLTAVILVLAAPSLCTLLRVKSPWVQLTTTFPKSSQVWTLQAVCSGV